MRAIFLLIVLAICSCSGLGLKKNCTLVPDKIKLEIDVEPGSDEYQAKRIRGGFEWNLK